MTILEMNSVLFEDINQRVQRYLLNPFLTYCDIVPEANEFHFDVASAILRLGEVQKDEAKDVLTAVLLLQRGLSIHDEIDAQNGRRRQLYVLTGDFSSSQYYYVLAHLGDGQLLYTLCDAVVRVNEAKMALLDLPVDAPVERQAYYYSMVEGELLYALVDRYLDHPQEWRQKIESLVRAYVLKEVPSLQEVTETPSRQGHEWLNNTLDRLIVTHKIAALAPISSLLMENVRSIQKKFERHLTLSEENS